MPAKYALRPSSEVSTVFVTNVLTPERSHIIADTVISAIPGETLLFAMRGLCIPQSIPRYMPRNARDDDSEGADPEDTVPVSMEARSPESNNLLDEDSLEHVTPSSDTLLFSADLYSSASNQHSHFALAASTADADGNSVKELCSGHQGICENTNVPALSDVSAIVNNQQNNSPSVRQPGNSPMQGGSLNQPAANTALLSQDITFANLDFFEPFLGLPYDASDFLGLQNELGHLETVSNLPQLGNSVSQRTDFVYHSQDLAGNIALFGSHTSLPKMSALGTTMPQTHSQAHNLPLKSNLVEDPTKLSDPSPTSTTSSLSSLLEVTKPEQVKRTHFRITEETRTALYKDLTTRLSQDELWEYEHPEALALEKCLRSYVDAFHIHLPILHVSSLTVEETSSPLILIMCAIGALYRLERKLAISMYRKASQAFDRSMSAWLAINESLVVIEAFNPQSEEMSQPKSLPLWMMQARFLLAVFGTLNGNAGLIKRAFGLLSAQWTVRIPVKNIVCTKHFAGLSLGLDFPERSSECQRHEMGGLDRKRVIQEV
ncbi:uncharacterized protein A1O5_02206 [Cladophialophora psammophila CBS 110553]|uniref:Xylanolytic transcriptional activator regulatory domain-containing protein n=1 Tax=Cladophialophora psammophila CBS 110553 TaxID=1182543 RepID=W9X0D0_9EURO|nr:uncharacterized protein A1O5_02206 [Cladophialophora psammophila CBS 110553]EXJ73912.1 hypothetical protein A1O5_02206 [Cladophialophora psammophila CBS 110553]